MSRNEELEKEALRYYKKQNDPMGYRVELRMSMDRLRDENRRREENRRYWNGIYGSEPVPSYCRAIDGPSNVEIAIMVLVALIVVGAALWFYRVYSETNEQPVNLHLQCNVQSEGEVEYRISCPDGRGFDHAMTTFAKAGKLDIVSVRQLNKTTAIFAVLPPKQVLRDTLP